MDCIFCKIINGDIPSYTLYEDDIVKVMLDINPKADGHMLVIPKNHTLDIDTIDNDTLIHIIEVSRKMKKLLEEKLNVKGVMLVQNNGELEEVKHFHLHLIPKYNNEEKLSLEEVYNKLK